MRYKDQSCHSQGWEDHRNGKLTVKDNPHQAGTWQSQAWLDGWNSYKPTDPKTQTLMEKRK